MIIDTHCHLDFKDFDTDRDGVIDRALKAGVSRIINVASSIEGTHHSIELAKKYDIVYASIGVHPHEATSVTDKVIEDFKILAKNDKVVAIGEVGLDYYRNLSPKDAQIAAFEKFIKLAQEVDLPLIIHSREADEDILTVLKKYTLHPTPPGLPSATAGTGNTQHIKGVMHCFSEDESFLKECLDIGLHISFTCNLTFKNAKALREVAKKVPIDKLMLETDAPFLAPEGMRGKRNEPSYLTILVDEWSRISGLSKEDIERITTHNANELFKLNLDEEKPRIAYKIRDSLYLNITNECTNKCDFCVKAQTEFVKGHNLKLDKEPSVEEVLNAIGDPSKYKEIIFCGYGEPTIRLDVVKAVAKAIKVKGQGSRVNEKKIRLVTNGHGDLINKRPIVKELTGLIDRVSVSLNTDKKELYNKYCKSQFGIDTYDAIVKFIKDCVKNNIETEITCLNLPGVDIKECEKIAKALGASFRLRIYGVTG